MPSPTHQTFVALLRAHPEIPFELARRAGLRVADRHDHFEEVTPEFDDPLQPGRTVSADLALVGYVGGRPIEGLIVEVQLGEARGLALGANEAERIASIADPEELQRLVARAATIETIEDLAALFVPSGGPSGPSEEPGG